MTEMMIPHNIRKRLLELPAILTMVAVAVGGLVSLNRPSDRIQAAVRLGLFALILFAPLSWKTRPILTHIRLGILCALAASLMVLQNGWNFFPILFFLLAPMALVHRSVRAGLAWIGIYTLVTGAMLVYVNGWVGLALLLPFAAGYVFFGIFGWTMIDSDRNRKRSEQLLAELQTAHQQLQEYAAQVEELTIAQERNRIAREMHDTLGHRLTIAAVQLEGAQRLIPTHPERAASIVGTVREQVKEGLAELRRTVALLRASTAEDLPLEKALTRLAEQVQQATSLKIHLSLQDCPPELAFPQRQAIYRAAQEGLTNIQRHARASDAWLQLSARDGMLELLISDNGVGIAPENVQPETERGLGGFGLVGLQERAALQGGEFHVDARPAGGTQITFRLPLARETPPQAEPGGAAHE